MSTSIILLFAALALFGTGAVYIGVRNALIALDEDLFLLDSSERLLIGR